MPRKTPVPPVPEFDPGTDLSDLTDAELGFAPVEEAEFTEAPEEKPVPAPIRALATTADHHTVVGMGTLAAMGEDEFQAKLAEMKRGQERLRTIQASLLIAGEDYGKIKGIDKPFLHQPGAEKLANFYGFAVRQEAERITRRQGDAEDVPPYEFIVKSFVHLGDFDGPIVAQGFGEASPFEEKYRYRWTKPACPTCGKTDTLVKRKTPPQLAGKFSCANWQGKAGCGNVFEPNDPRIGPQGKEQNPDLWGLAETILLMASKRSHVSAVRRATGTSGLFTQDADSPSVVAQSEESGDDAAPVVTSAQPIGVPVAPGGRTTQVTQVQLDALKRLSVEKGLNGAKIADLLSRLFGMEVEPTGAAASAAVRSLNANQMGQLLITIETGALPEIDPPEVPSGGPDDIGAK